MSSHLECISLISDPVMAFCFVFPIGYYSVPGIGLLILWTCTFADILTIVLKIAFHEDRPYWWVGKNVGKVPDVSIAQYPLTCAILPGGPSGHCLVTSAVYWAILAVLFKCEKMSLTLIYGIFMILVAVSRIFLAANFPHQAIMGVFFGIVLGNYVASTKLYNSPSVYYLYASAFSVILSGLYSFLSPLLGIQIKWTFCAADKHCYDTDWTNQNPFQDIFPFFRSAGVLAGTGISLLLTSAFQPRIIILTQHRTKRCVSVILSIILIFGFKCVISTFDKYPPEALVYFSKTFMEFLSIPIIVILLIPKLLNLYEIAHFSL